MALVKSPEEYRKEQEAKKMYSIPALRPDAKKISELPDPIDDIAAAMAARGFSSLWTEAQANPTARLKKFDDRLKVEFLRHYATSGRINFSAAACGISTFAINQCRKADPVFCEALAEAHGYFQDLLIGEMYRRGVTGYQEDVICGPDRDKVIKITKYSDRMLETLAKIKMPELQKKQVELSGKVEGGGNTVNNVVNNFDFTSLPAEELAMYKELISKQAERNLEAPSLGNIIDGEIVDAGDTGPT